MYTATLAIAYCSRYHNLLLSLPRTQVEEMRAAASHDQAARTATRREQEQLQMQNAALRAEVTARVAERAAAARAIGAQVGQAQAQAQARDDGSGAVACSTTAATSTMCPVAATLSGARRGE